MPLALDLLKCVSMFSSNSMRSVSPLWFGSRVANLAKKSHNLQIPVNRLSYVHLVTCLSGDAQCLTR